jgi:hypothetical protein
MMSGKPVAVLCDEWQTSGSAVLFVFQSPHFRLLLFAFLFITSFEPAAASFTVSFTFVSMSYRHYYEVVCAMHNEA